MLIFALVLVLSLTPGTAFAARYASIIIDSATGEVLHAVNPDRRSFPASLTKLMTLYLVFEALKSKRLLLDQELTVSRLASRRAPSKLGLKKNTKIRVRDIIAAMVTKSANDAATVAAEALAGTEKRFARNMTAKARHLGMSRTTFRNASGLPNRRQISTARDMARLAVALARDFPEYYHQFSLPLFEYKGRRYRNHNRLLKRYRGTDGLKTGYTRASGFNLAVSVARDGRRLVGIVFGGKSARWRDSHMIWLLNQAFASIKAGDEPPLPLAMAAGDTEVDSTPEAEAGSKPGVVRKERTRPKAGAGKRRTRPTRTSIARAADRRTNNWGIQIGAYYKYAPAHLAATRAARVVPGLMRTRLSITTSKGRRKTIYRARLLGMSERKARRACARLKRKKMDCLVLRNGDKISKRR
jgi:D-alanyl-D-alanine carboxypeptidase